MLKLIRRLLTSWRAKRGAAEVQRRTLLMDASPYQAETARNLIKSTTGQAYPTGPFDEKLLERSIERWQLGDWGSLIAINPEELQLHPERNKLALLVAASQLQLGNTAEARQLLKQASKWGANNTDIAKLVISGVHNNLGRAVSVLGKIAKANDHFTAAIRSVNPDCDISRLSSLRAITQSPSKSGGADFDLLNFLQGQSQIPLFVDCGRYVLNRTYETINGRAVDRKNVKVPGGTRAFSHRPESKGDIGVIKQVFEQNQYDFEWIPQGEKVAKLFKRLQDSGEIPTIIDGGGNIGASCVWFSYKFPDSTILAIEPDQDNCKLLAANCEDLPVKIFPGALSNKRRILYFQDPDQSDWGFRVGETGSRPVPCIGPYDLMYECQLQGLTPVIIKLDIEGGEELFFEGECEWMAHIAVIIIELHDWLLPEQSTSLNFLNAIARHKFQVFTRGENLFCFNRKILENSNKLSDNPTISH